MRLLKWLFQPAYILLIIVLVALYVNRMVVFPEQVAESLEAEALVAKAEGLIEQLRSDAVSPAVDESQVAGSAKAESPMALVAATGQTETRDTVTSQGSDGAVDLLPDAPASGETPQLPAAAESGVSGGGIVAPVVPSPQDEPLQSVGADVGATGGAVSPVAPSPDEESPSQAEATSLKVAGGVPAAVAEGADAPSEEAAAVGAEPLAVWRDARAAVWQGDLDTAVQHYRAVIALQPSNFDAHGELGNVLLAQNKFAAAIDAYTAAARLIRQAGHIKMAYRMVGVIASLDEAQGRSLFDEFTQR